MARLSVRTVMITGGVSGLGFAMASAFAATGAYLYVGGQMSDKKAAHILAQLKKKRGRFLPLMTLICGMQRQLAAW